MWIYFKEGFVSIKKLPKGNDMYCVRARDRESLEAFTSMNLGVDGTIYHTPEADYPWKVDLNQVDVSLCIYKLINEIDYASFKDSITSKLLKPMAFKLWLYTKEAFSPRESIFTKFNREQK